MAKWNTASARVWRVREWLAVPTTGRFCQVRGPNRCSLISGQWQAGLAWNRRFARPVQGQSRVRRVMRRHRAVVSERGRCRFPAIATDLFETSPPTAPGRSVHLWLAPVDSTAERMQASTFRWHRERFHRIQSRSWYQDGRSSRIRSPIREQPACRYDGKRARSRFAPRRRRELWC